MQLFNGITLRNLMMFGVRFDGNPEAESGGESIFNIDTIQDEINQLKNGETTDDEISGIDSILTVEVEKYFVQHLDVANQLILVIEDYKNGKADGQLASGVKEVYDFLKSIVGHKNFDFQISSEFNHGNIAESESIKKDAILGRIAEITEGGRFASTLTNIKTVLDNPNPSNVKQLQQYIFDAVYANLSQSEKDSFKAGGRFVNGAWNGQIDAKLFEGVDIVLTKIENTLRGEETDRRTVGGLTFNAVVMVEQMTAGAQVFSMEASSSSGGDSQDVGASSVVQSEHVESQDNGIYNIAKERLHLSEGEKICLMDVAGKKYLVKLDSGNCLYPLALSVDGNNIGNTVLLQNNTSCMEYLRKKIPDVPYCRNMDISWNGKKYVIGVPGSKRLTIEPMTFDGKWLGGANLDQSLALLCFVNYLRNSKDFNGYEFKNDNPDLDWDDGKLLVSIKKNKDAKKASGEKDKALVDLATYGLGFLSDGNNDDIRRRFIRYNNGEHREDNWNKKGDNQGYGALDVQQVMEEQQRLQAAAGQRQQSQGEQGNGRVDNREGSSQFSVDVSSQTLSLTAFSGTFNYSLFGITGTEGSPQIFESGAGNDKTYYWKEGEMLYSISEETPYLKSSKSFDGDIRTDRQLDVGGMTTTLNVCDKGATQLNDKLLSMYNQITGKSDGSLPEGLSIDITNDNYSLKFDNSKSIPLDDVIFSQNDGKFCGFDNKSLEQRLKIALLACVHYDQIESSDRDIVITNAEKVKYGIDDSNKTSVQQRFNDLNVGSNKNLVILPGEDEIRGIGKFEDGKFKLKDGVDTNGSIVFGDVSYKFNATVGLCYELHDSGIYIGECVDSATGRGIALSSDEKREGKWIPDAGNTNGFVVDNYGFSGQ